MKDVSRPILLLASERSGSNLLRVLFGNHTKVSAPVAPQLTNAFMHILDRYGDLSCPESARRMLKHMIAYSRHEFSGWDLPESAEAVYEKFRPQTFLQCLHAVYQSNAEHEGKQTFFSKENELYLFAPAWCREFPESRFIYLARDPRDCAASWKKRPQSYTLTSYMAAMRWAEEQRTFFKWKEAFGLPVCTVTYEQLIENPAGEMERLLEFCGLDVESACFETQPERNKEASTSAYWKNLAKPIMKDNAKKYRKALTDDEICIVESLGKTWMDRLGYELDTDADWSPDKRFKKVHKRRKKQAQRIHGGAMKAFAEKNIASREQLLSDLLGE